MIAWVVAGLGVLAVIAVVVLWAACSLSGRLSRDDIMEHYLDDY